MSFPTDRHPPTPPPQEKAASYSVRTSELASRPPRRSRWRRRTIIYIALALLAVLGLALGLGLGLGLKHSSPHSGPFVSPSTPFHLNATSTNATTLAVGTTWDYPLGVNLTTGIANSSTHFYGADLQNTPATTIAGLIAAGHFIACYFSAGSIESYRPDAGDIPSAAIGNVLNGWPDEKWLDVRNPGVRTVMGARIQLAQAKGCHGIDADNIDGFSNDSGFNLTADDAVDYITFLSNATQAAGMLYGLKNGGEVVDRVLDQAAWVVQESCVEYDECDVYEPFVMQGKPVFHVEYTDSENATVASVNASFIAEACGAGGERGFSSIVKHLSLDNWVIACA